jgi:hypothetical protein
MPSGEGHDPEGCGDSGWATQPHSLTLARFASDRSLNRPGGQVASELRLAEGRIPQAEGSRSTGRPATRTPTRRFPSSRPALHATPRARERLVALSARTRRSTIAM